MKNLKQLLVAMVLTVSAQAAAIQFTFTGQGSGTLGGNAFVNTSFTITGWGDTDNRQDNGAAYWIDHDSASIDLGGNVYDFTSATRTFFFYSVLGSQTPGFSRAGSSGNDLYDGPVGNSTLAGWDMLSGIGPVSGSLFLTQWDVVFAPPVATTGGILIFNQANSAGTFAATMAVPDAGSTIALLGCALLGLAALRRRSVA